MPKCARARFLTRRMIFTDDTAGSSHDSGNSWILARIQTRHSRTYLEYPVSLEFNPVPYRPVDARAIPRARAGSSESAANRCGFTARRGARANYIS